MKNSVRLGIATIVVGGLPLSAIAAVPSAPVNNLLFVLTIGVLVLIGIVSIWVMRPVVKRSPADRMLQTVVHRVEANWAQMSAGAHVGPGELESAVCSFETYLSREGAQRILEAIQLSANNQGAASRSLLEHAERVFPGAYRALDARGRENQLTRIARRFFLCVVTEATREYTEYKALELSPGNIRQLA